VKHNLENWALISAMPGTLISLLIIGMVALSDCKFYRGGGEG